MSFLNNKAYHIVWKTLKKIDKIIKNNLGKTNKCNTFAAQNRGPVAQLDRATAF